MVLFEEKDTQLFVQINQGSDGFIVNVVDGNGAFVREYIDARGTSIWITPIPEDMQARVGMTTSLPAIYVRDVKAYNYKKYAPVPIVEPIALVEVVPPPTDADERMAA